MKSIKVLLADDHKIFREGIIAMLRDEEQIQIVEEASTGKEVERILENTPIDVILLDIKMPEMNGMDTAKFIKERYPATKILVFSSFDEDRYIFKMIQIGISGYILKTISLSNLLTAIKTVANGDSYFSKEVSKKVVRQFSSSRTQKVGIGDQLTEREQEILKLVAKGLTNAEMGDMLFISPRTVDTHRRNLMQKLDLHNVMELTQYAREHGFLD